MFVKEQNIEEKLIKKLRELNYVYRSDIRDRESLEKNFREKFESLNRVKLTDNEFERLLEQITSPDVFSCSKILRQQNTFEREDRTPLHYTLVNIKDWCKNTFEVVKQIRINTKNSFQRYDVILLINGLPLVQIELKSLKISPRRAIEQIVKYKNEPGNGYGNTLLAFMQLFIVSNFSETWYFVNNNNEHFKFDANEQFLPIYKFADPDNKKITQLYEFAKKFLSKCTLAEMIGRYMVLIESERKLLMMRPYQIYAAKAIVDCIHQNRGNGYIWHTTGSGKTLTSFKASTLLKDNPDVEKVLFVVDRKDLDKQTREEFNKFQPGCVEENTNTRMLVNRLLSDDYKNKVIVTTIQKLGLALDGNNKKEYRKQLEPLKNKRVVFIFDECHRSQFGENHRAIREFFPNAQLFGFTGTPIFEENASYKIREGKELRFKTTEDIFQKLLHAYTITHAIDDGNVLKFRVEYYKPKSDTDIAPKDLPTKRAIIESILEKHDKLTNFRRFNALFATASINDAIEYYELFQKIQEEKQKENPEFKPLNLACVFSPPAEGNKDILQLQEDLEQEKEDLKVEPNKKKEALKKIISDYNKKYKTHHDIFNFDIYYQDIQKRIKDQKYPNNNLPHREKIDITIVVDMLLTGFDSKYLNTLYVDKNLKYHGLIQAFSRTNRVLNNTKPYGNIIDFRAQRNNVDEAIVLFSGEKKKGAKEIWIVDPAPVIIEKYKNAVENLKTFMESQNLEFNPSEVANLKGDEARIEFINTFKEVQRLFTQIDQYTDISDEDKKKIEELLPEESLTSFRTVYLDLARDIRERQGKTKDSDDPIQQVDLEFVLFDSALIDYDYIMKLISKYTYQEPKKQEVTRTQLIEMLSSNAKFLDEKEDLIEYINSLEKEKPLNEEDVRKGYEIFKENKRKNELKEIAKKHGIEFSSLFNFVNNILDRMIFDADALTELLAPLNLGWKARAKKELALMDDLIPILRKLAQGQNISGLEVYDE
ncbi:type I restriction enzyme R subunit [Thermotomaculum hydrothermale]|uniref:Type I restriction enzyme endonuclease subunit n=1 Tax=Thermotomaculum hydrothermale TaxID=981385 RepID=A0A7R6PP78_9BACT|nr:type I restriction endonuclease subunit R [Thermotomaculum hydrothermale]BBB32751.1 type I restriction enzyme R subunit [Thermotomaculum hydrothermale]